MFEYLKGALTHSSPHKITVEVGGIGYGIFISIATFEKLPKMGSDVKVFISPVIREDSQRLFGFLSAQERDFFETLNDISGIGPRLSISILGHMTMEDLHLAVEHANTKAISKIPGIGKKMAERLTLELRDKFHKDGKENISLASNQAPSVMGDAISALANLGYNPLEAQKTVKNVIATASKELSLSELISLSLKAKKV
ncbi:MAG: Holliday junction ATP-dependent DNA helicase RuvA [Chlamydiae bacterium]|nr:Holliday junction ATP-dependent DNA helicase RuvA [Chlamydiota bacterium]